MGTQRCIFLGFFRRATSIPAVAPTPRLITVEQQKEGIDLESKLFAATVIKITTKRFTHACLYKVCFKIHATDDQPEEIVFGTQLISDYDSLAPIRRLRVRQHVKARLDYSFETPRIVQLIIPKKKRSHPDLEKLFWYNARKDREYQERLAQR